MLIVKFTIYLKKNKISIMPNLTNKISILINFLFNI